MNDFQFHNTTKVYFGKDQLGHLHEEVLKYGKSVLVVYGGGLIKKIGLYDKVMIELKDNNVEVYVSFLRRKLHFLNSKVSIKAVRNVGYKLEFEDGNAYV